MILGVDIGGHSIKAVRLLDDGSFDGQAVRPTGNGQPADLQDRILRVAGDLSAASRPSEVVLGVGGLICPESGKILASGALPRLRNCQLAQRLSQELQVPVRLFKDSLLATYAEWKIGAGQGRDHFVLVLVGATITAGAVSEGRLLLGHTRNFGGLGHFSVDPQGPLCVCGNRGCLSLLGSSQGLARHYRDITHVDKSPEEVSSLVLDADPSAERALAQTCRCLAIGLGAMINFLDPGLVLISGGLSTLGETLLEPIRRELMATVFPEKLVHISVLCGNLGGYAGAMGAALYGRDHPA